MHDVRSMALILPEKRVIVGDRDGEVIAQRARLPVSGKLVPDAHVHDAGGLESPRDNKDIG